jgi:outer membrane protein TolC
VRLAFYEAQAARQDVEVLHVLANAASSSRQLVQSLHDAGNVSDLDLDVERAFEAETELRVTEAESKAQAALGKLRMWMALSPDAGELRVAKQLPAPSADEAPLADLTTRALERSLSLQVIDRAHVALDERASAASVNGYLPELRAGAAFERNEGEWEIGPTASLSVPLFDRGQGERGVLLAESRGLEYERQLREQELRTALATTRARLTAAAAIVRNYGETLLPLRKRIVEQTLLHYNAMDLGVQQLVTAKSEQLEAERAYIAALHGYWVLKARLDHLIAGGSVSGEPSGTERSAAGHEGGM